jgi:EAL domain-containing protein (putative c-di-GMP-specific phosphodiesterase class I)
MLMQHADVAMYVAKRSGSGIAVYTSEQDENSPLRLSLATELREAIDKNELVLCYQPQIEIATGRVIGVEALVRWQREGDGLVSPEEFITVAEDTGLIIPLSRWVMRHALRDVPRLRECGLDLAIAVNLSVRTLHDPDLVDTVRAALQLFPVPPQLTVEVTESALMHDPVRAIEALTELHKMGVRIAVDDFGIGYSSLAYLRALPVHEIKIDRSFVAGMLASPNEVSIVRAIARLGQDLGLTVVAEGVENERTLDLVASLGCDVAQGYYLSYPLFMEDLIAWLSNRAKGKPSLRQVSSG